MEPKRPFSTQLAAMRHVPADDKPLLRQLPAKSPTAEGFFQDKSANARNALLCVGARKILHTSLNDAKTSLIYISIWASNSRLVDRKWG